MRKALFLFLLILISCTPAPMSTPIAGNTNSPGQDYLPSIEAFDVSAKCPHICWMRINPGVTSAEEARLLLRASNQIDQETFHVSTNGIKTKWFIEKRKTNYSEVAISNVDGHVESITFSQLAPFTIGDLLNLFGEPDEISLRIDKAADAEDISYMIYYTNKKMLIWVMPGSRNGPQPTDHNIEMLVLGTEFKILSPSWLADYGNYRQPWLGYGHLEDYLSGQVTPPENNLQTHPP
ncbi:MAG: hypothetical protein NTW32_27220 [Chloroflexi bacterium]|nr:hypothetical protein [Chloroflexota bacterium]